MDHDIFKKKCFKSKFVYYLNSQNVKKKNLDE